MNATKHISALLLLLCSISVFAQKRNYPFYYAQYGLPSGTFLDGGPYGYFGVDFIRKNHIDSACIQNRRCSGGKVTGEGGIKTQIRYDSAAFPIQKTVHVNGRISLTYRFQYIALPGTGWEWRRETWDKHYKLSKSNIHRYDTIHQTDSSWSKSSASKPFRLTFTSVRNTRGRYLSATYYFEKGKQHKILYTYDESGEKLLTMASYNEKNKLLSFTDYRCLPAADTFKVRTTSICERTDKDPMGNIIEIREEQRGKYTMIVKYKYSPDKKRLLETSYQRKNSTKLSRTVFTYDNENRITEINFFYNAGTVPSYTSKYYYAGDLPVTYEYYKNGRLVQMSVYTFTRSR